jgi:hypothetical protein
VQGDLKMIRSTLPVQMQCLHGVNEVSVFAGHYFLPTGVFGQGLHCRTVTVDIGRLHVRSVDRCRSRDRFEFGHRRIGSDKIQIIQSHYRNHIMSLIS